MATRNKPAKNSAPPAGANPARRKSVQGNGRRMSMRGGDDAEGQDNMDFDDQDAMDLAPIEVKRVPEHQVEGLTQQELDEVFTKVITAADPNVAKSLTRFHYITGEFKLEPTIDHLAVHFQMDGILVHIESEEARDYVEAEAQVKVKTSKKAPAKPVLAEPKDGEEEEEEADPEKQEQLKNQFNFSERATQTFNNPMRNKDICTEPPPTREFCEQVTHWDIFDLYLEDYERKLMVANQEEKKKVVGKKKAEGEETEMVFSSVTKDTPTSEPSDMLLSNVNLARAIKMMERMVHTNSEAECFQDYKYYEDKSEHKREDGRGSFLPLWRFASEKASRKTVTGICWNPEFTDLVAIGYGSYDFANATQNTGLICCYSLKNTSHPEYTIECESGVMSLDFHHVHSSLLCVGMYDGTVSVYDVRNKTGAPIYTSSDPRVKHTEPVWQVCWSRDKKEPDKDIFFYSVSSDGRVTKWTLSKNDLICEQVVELKLKQDREDKETASSLVGLAGGCCFDFNTANRDVFVVGTEEGSIQCYTNTYNSTLLKSYQGHHMATYAVRWNTFHPEVFLSCSADWTVKLWERSVARPIMTFDLNTSVGDVAWAPFSSTVFATITTDGRVRVYDLSVNKHEPLGETRLNKKAKLSHIAFNPREPIICVGDDRGVVTILKLSSNLRKMSAPKLEDLEKSEEIAKLNKVMIMPEEDEPFLPQILS